MKNKESIGFQEKCEDVAIFLEMNPSSNAASDIAYAITELSKNSKNEEKVNKKKLEEYMFDLMVINKIKQDQENTILERFLNDKYLRELNELNDYEKTSKKRDLHPTELTRKKELSEVLYQKDGLTKKTSEMYYMENILNPEILNQDFSAYSNEKNPIKKYKDAVSTDIQKTYKSLNPKSGKNGEKNKSAWTIAVCETFNKSFGTKKAMGLSTARILYNPVGFSTGIVIKTSIALFLQTPSGKELSTSLSDKWQKVFNQGEKSKLSKSVIVGLAAVGVLGMTYAGLEDHLPEGMQQVFDTAMTNTKETLTNFNATEFANNQLNKAKEMVDKVDISNGLNKVTELAKNIDIGQPKIENVNINPNEGMSFFEKTKLAMSRMINSDIANASPNTIQKDITLNNTEALRSLNLINEAPTKESEIVNLQEKQVITDKPLEKEINKEPEVPKEKEINKELESPKETETVKAKEDGKINIVEDNFTLKTISAGDNLESYAKEVLGKDAKYEDIRKFTLKIAEVNDIADANKISEGVIIKIPTDLDTSNIESPKFKLNSLEDLANFDIPYGADVTVKTLTDDILSVVKSNYPSQSFEDLIKLKIQLTESLSSMSSNGVFDSMNEPNLKAIKASMTDSLMANAIDLKADTLIANATDLKTPSDDLKVTSTAATDSRKYNFGMKKL